MVQVDIKSNEIEFNLIKLIKRPPSRMVQVDIKSN